MIRSPYEILGISNDASMDEITRIYNIKKEQLNKLVLSEGEIGTEAANKLQLLKEAYQEILDSKGGYTISDDTNNEKPQALIEKLIKDNKLEEAQRLLDSQADRGAEWHYLQSALYYKKGWIMESKLQLELAMKLNPDEKKYNKAYNSLINLMTYGNPNGPEFNQDFNSGRSYPPNRPSDDVCCNICGAIMCADCCCDCLGH